MLQDSLDEALLYQIRVNHKDNDPLTTILEKYSDKVTVSKEKSKKYDFGQKNLPKKLAVYSAQVNYNTVDSLLKELNKSNGFDNSRIIGARNENGTNIIQYGDYGKDGFVDLLKVYQCFSQIKEDLPSSIYIVPKDISDKVIELKFNPLDDQNNGYLEKL